MVQARVFRSVVNTQKASLLKIKIDCRSSSLISTFKQQELRHLSTWATRYLHLISYSDIWICCFPSLLVLWHWILLRKCFMTTFTGINFHSFIVSWFPFHEGNQTFFEIRSVPNTNRILTDSLHFFSSAGNLSPNNFLIPSITSFFHLVQSKPVPCYLFSTSLLLVLW